ncbi:hypothetical protein AKO1_013526 [Acrasis kona]|uniref:PAS domain-containing protein n=1 Tax=Acrasis kona TaxID=1008807 RepID=A0AAW2ZJM8_9EUKA
MDEDSEKRKQIELLRVENQQLSNHIQHTIDSAQEFVRQYFGRVLPPMCGMVVTIEHGIIIVWDSVVREHLGYSEEDLFTLVQRWPDIVWDKEEAIRHVSTLFEAAAAKKETCDINNLHLKHKQGHSVVCDRRVMFHYDFENQRPLFTVSILTFHKQI